MDSSSPKASNRPSATVATCAGKKLIASWLLHSPDVRVGIAGSSSRSTLRTLPTVSPTAAPVGSGLTRTISDVFTVGRCETGK